MSILKQQFVILRGATDISWQHEVVYYTTFFILDVVFMSKFLSYSVYTFLKTTDCQLYGLQRLELNKIGTKRTLGVLNICHRPVISKRWKENLVEVKRVSNRLMLYRRKCLRLYQHTNDTTGVSGGFRVSQNIL